MIGIWGLSLTFVKCVHSFSCLNNFSVAYVTANLKQHAPKEDDGCHTPERAISIRDLKIKYRVLMGIIFLCLKWIFVL